MLAIGDGKWIYLRLAPRLRDRDGVSLREIVVGLKEIAERLDISIAEPYNLKG